jgi:hypothetical protein
LSVHRTWRYHRRADRLARGQQDRQHTLEVGLAVLFILVAVLTLGQVLL